MNEFMLSTKDNPFDPFTQFVQWSEFDEAKGYNSPQLLARVAILADSLSLSESHKAIEEAIDEIIKIDPLGIYIKVARTNSS